MRRLFLAMSSRKAVIGMLAVIGLVYLLLAVTGGRNLAKKAERQNAAKIQTINEREAALQKKILEDPALAVNMVLVFLLVLGAGASLDIWFFVKKVNGRPWRTRGPSTLRAAAWGVKDVFGFFVFLLFVELCLIFFENVFFAAFGRGAFERDFLLMANTLMRDLIAVAFVLYLVRYKFGQSFREVGLNGTNIWRDIKIGLLGYLAVIPLLMVSFLVLILVMRCFAYEPAPQNVVEIYLRPSSDKYLIFFTLLVAILGPMMEEIFFRGYAYQAFKRRFGFGWAAAASAAIFAAFHLNLVAFVPIFVLGYFFAYLYERTGSLVSPIAAHVAHNLIMVGLTLGFKALTA